MSGEKIKRVVPREEITDETYREIIDVEIHHNHPIIETELGTYRWKENEAVRRMVDQIGLNELLILFQYLGWGKNSEQWRQLYRDMGYSLFGYWEIFYWEVNNEEANEYHPPKPLSVVIEQDKSCEMLSITNSEGKNVFYGNEWDFNRSGTNFKNLFDKLGLKSTLIDKKMDE